MSEKKIRKKLLDFGLLRKVFAFAAPYKRKFYMSIFLSIALAILSPLRPYFIQYKVNHFIQYRNTYRLFLIKVIH